MNHVRDRCLEAFYSSLASSYSGGYCIRIFFARLHCVNASDGIMRYYLPRPEKHLVVRDHCCPTLLVIGYALFWPCVRIHVYVVYSGLHV